MVRKITKLKYENQALFILNNDKASAKPKIMIFVNNIEDTQYIAAYFSSKLPPKFQNKWQEIICIFLSNL